MRSFFRAFARNTVFANILLALIVTAGTLAMFNMTRETFPDFSLDAIQILIRWPGADPEEVEEGISRKIEEALEGIEGIKRYHTFSREHYGVGMVEVDESYDMDYVKERVRNAVEAISNFPRDAEKPIVEEALLKLAVCFIALSGEDMSEEARKEWAETLKEEVRALPGISQVEVLGNREYEVGIEISEERLREYGLSFEEVAGMVRANSLNLSGGTMRTQGEEIRLRTLGRNYTADDFAKIVVRALPNGTAITLDRIATIKDEFIEDRVLSRFNGSPTITLGITKTVEEDGLAIDEVVLDYVAKKRLELPEGLDLSVWGRMADILQARIRLLLRNGLIGLALVFVLLWLFLDVRLSFWAGIGMPVSVMGALAVMWMLGATINMISLFGLIMVLGIIVDDAIVVGEAIYVARKNGAPPLRAAVNGVMEVGMPVLAAVTTTIVAFVPLSFVGGFMGKFISILPVVVISCLAISLIECLLLLPAHLSHLPAFNRKMETRQRVRRFGQRFHRFTNEGLEWFVDHMYAAFVSWSIRYRYLSLCVTIAIALATLGLLEGGFLKFQFFPELDGNSVSANIEFPNGTPLTVTGEAVTRLEEAIHRVGDRLETRSGEALVKNTFSLVGARIDDKGGSDIGVHLGTVRVELLDSAKRAIYFKDILAAWEEELGNVAGVVAVTFIGDELAPPGAPVEIWLQGHDMDPLLAAAADLERELSDYVGLYQIQNDFRRGKNEIKIRLKDEAPTMGVTVADLARQIYAGYFGEEAVRIQRGRDDVRVRVRYPFDERRSVSEFEKIRIRTRYGFEVPLLSVADIDYGPGYAAITRTDGMRRVVVTAEVDITKANAGEIVAQLESDYFPKAAGRFPNVLMSFQGEQESMRESVESLLIGFPLALLAIYIIIATVFRSYVQPLIIMVTVPFGMVGAVLGHYLMGFDLSMMSVFGMTALAGVVVNDAIVLIECVNNYIAHGEDFYVAVRRGGVRRFRAIFLTTISTVGGLTPLIIEKDFQAQILIPMALSLAGGVAFATLLTLVLIPCLLCILNDARRILARLTTGRWPAPSEVEPARHRFLDGPPAAGPDITSAPGGNMGTGVPPRVAG